MSIASPITDRVEICVSRYDRWNAAVISLIILLGFLCSLLLMSWLTAAYDNKPIPIPPKPGTPIPVPTDLTGADKENVLEPSSEEFPEVAEQDLTESDLIAVQEAASTVFASWQQSGIGIEGNGEGSRGKLKRGTIPEFVDVVPDYKRWKVEYESESLKSYAQQLDFFAIYLGAVSTDSNDIWVVRSLSHDLAATHSDRKTQGSVLRFEHQRQRMRRWDQTLCKRAGVDLTNRIVVQFFPAETRTHLRTIERQYLGKIGRELKEVRKTKFKLVPAGTGFEFKITNMLFKN